MKRNVNKFLIIVICFVFIMGFSLFFFMNRYNNIDIKNKVNVLLKDLYNMDSGAYLLKNGIIYHSDYKISLKRYLNASGDIEIDKYNNVRLDLSYDNKCISKTYMGNIIINDGKCKGFKDIDIKINRNNNKISFISNTKNLEYKISSSDDFKGEWIKEDYKDNIVLKKYNEGNNFIWFKDKDGNLSKVSSFKVECFNAVKSEYDKNVFYCSGSIIKLDNIDFVVIKDDSSTIKLMKYLALDEKMSQCLTEESEYCFYQNEIKNTYNWENSYINFYINNEFYNRLSDNTKKNLIESKICTDLNSICDEELCIGKSYEEIIKNDYKCNSYTNSLVKLISYDEFNYLYSKVKNKNVLNGYYHSIDSYSLDYGSSIQYDQSVYVYEDLLKKIDVKPVIILSK